MTVRSLSPFTHADGRRTAANLVDCLLADVEAACGGMSAGERRALENRFHVTLRADRRIRERFSKKRKRDILGEQLKQVPLTQKQRDRLADGETTK